MLLRSIKTEFVCQEYLKKLKRENRKITTRATYQNKIETYILPNLPEMMKSINNTACENFISILIEKKLSNKTINDAITILNSILSFAFNKKYIKELIKIKKLKENKNDKIEIFTDEEQETLVKYILKHLTPFNFSVFLALSTGLRLSELAGLKKEYVYDDFIFVKYNLLRVKNLDYPEVKSKTIVITTDTKSEDSEREIPLDDFVINLYKKFNYTDNSYITTNTNKYTEGKQIERKFEELLTACNIKYRKFHTLRHTFAMNCVRGGMKIEVLAKILGHSDIKVTLKYYIHFSLELKREAIYNSIPSWLKNLKLGMAMS